MSIVARRSALALVLLLTACGGRAEMPGQDSDVETVIVVDNQSNLDMVIYAVREAGDRTRLGTATAHLRSRFTIPSRLLFGITALRFQADPIGGRQEPISQSISVQQGDTIEMVIPPFQ